MRPHRLAAASIACSCAVAPLHVARADAIDACVSAATEGQKLERAGKLRDARTSFLACVKPTCPQEVKVVCDRFLAEVETGLPTVILGARDAAGQDLTAVRVTVDGTPFVSALDGKAVELDPGPHVLHFERADGAPVELRVVIREAEKNRALGVVFPSEAQPTPGSESPSREGPGRAPPPVLAYVLAGVGVASLGGFAYLGIHGQSQYDSCNPHACSQSTVDSLSVQRDLAFVTLGVGVVALGVATWLFLARPNVSHQAASTVSVQAGGVGIAF